MILLLELHYEVQGAFRPKRKPKAKKRRKMYFKHVVACLSGPISTHNPTRQEWENLYSIGLHGKDMHVPAIPNWLIGKEFHALLLSFPPALLSTSYKLCKLGGPYNNELIVFTSDNDASQRPHWSPESLRPVIGNRVSYRIFR